MQNIFTLTAIAKQLAAIKVDVSLHIQMGEPEKAVNLYVQADWLFNPVQDYTPQVEEEMVMLGIITELHTEITEHYHGAMFEQVGTSNIMDMPYGTDVEPEECINHGCNRPVAIYDECAECYLDLDK